MHVDDIGFLAHSDRYRCMLTFRASLLKRTSRTLRHRFYPLADVPIGLFNRFQLMCLCSHVEVEPLLMADCYQTLESDHYVCVRQKLTEDANPEVIIVDLKKNNELTRRPIKADSAIMHWDRQAIALKANQRTLQVFDLGQKVKLQSTTMNEDVVYWKWISTTTLGMVTETSVYHWKIFEGPNSAPQKLFDRNTNLSVRPSTIIELHSPDLSSYRAARSSITV